MATALLDLWALTLNRVFRLPATNWGHVGRWVASLPGPYYRSEPIAAAPAVRFERGIGWVTHYVIGIIYAVMYFGIVALLSSRPGIHTALAFGLATVVAPWFILQPGLGLGFMASRAPRPNLVRSLNLLAHLIFGFGLFIGWRITVLII